MRGQPSIKCVYVTRRPLVCGPRHRAGRSRSQPGEPTVIEQSKQNIHNRAASSNPNSDRRALYNNEPNRKRGPRPRALRWPGWRAAGRRAAPASESGQSNTHDERSKAAPLAGWRPAGERRRPRRILPGHQAPREGAAGSGSRNFRGPLSGGPACSAASWRRLMVVVVCLHHFYSLGGGALVSPHPAGRLPGAQAASHRPLLVTELAAGPAHAWTLKLAAAPALHSAANASSPGANQQQLAPPLSATDYSDNPDDEPADYADTAMAKSPVNLAPPASSINQSRDPLNGRHLQPAADQPTNLLVALFSAIDRQWSVPEVILVIVTSAILNLVTIVGNIMVLISFKMDRSLQTVSNYFLLSLAMADLLIGLISMPLYTLYLLLNRWPLGQLMCDIWLAIDYLNSNAAVLNMLVISFDRYFSVTRPLTYRAKRTTKHACLMILSAWILSLTIWTPAIFTYPYYKGRTVQGTDKCEIEFVKANTYLTFVTAILAFYIPATIMIYLYWRIWLETKKRYRDLTTLFLVSGAGAAAPARPARPLPAPSKRHQRAAQSQQQQQQQHQSKTLQQPPATSKGEQPPEPRVAHQLLESPSGALQWPRSGASGAKQQQAPTGSSSSPAACPVKCRWAASQSSPTTARLHSSPSAADAPSAATLELTAVHFPPTTTTTEAPERCSRFGPADKAQCYCCCRPSLECLACWARAGLKCDPSAASFDEGPTGKQEPAAQTHLQRAQYKHSHRLPPHHCHQHPASQHRAQRHQRQRHRHNHHHHNHHHHHDHRHRHHPSPGAPTTPSTAPQPQSTHHLHHAHQNHQHHPSCCGHHRHRHHTAHGHHHHKHRHHHQPQLSQDFEEPFELQQQQTASTMRKVHPVSPGAPPPANALRCNGSALQRPLTVVAAAANIDQCQPMPGINFGAHSARPHSQASSAPGSCPSRQQPLVLAAVDLEAAAQQLLPLSAPQSPENAGHAGRLQRPDVEASDEEERDCETRIVSAGDCFRFESEALMQQRPSRRATGTRDYCVAACMLAAGARQCAARYKVNNSNNRCCNEPAIMQADCRICKRASLTSRYLCMGPSRSRPLTVAAGGCRRCAGEARGGQPPTQASVDGPEESLLPVLNSSSPKGASNNLAHQTAHLELQKKQELGGNSCSQQQSICRTATGKANKRFSQKLTFNEILVAEQALVDTAAPDDNHRTETITASAATTQEEATHKSWWSLGLRGCWLKQLLCPYKQMSCPTDQAAPQPEEPPSKLNHLLGAGGRLRRLTCYCCCCCCWWLWCCKDSARLARFSSHESLSQKNSRGSSDNSDNNNNNNNYNQLNSSSSKSSHYPASHHPIQPKSERKAAKTLSTLLLVFIVTWLPYNILVLIKTLSGGEEQVPEKVWNFSYYLCYINSTINPLCYALCNAQFRRTYMRILKCKLSDEHNTKRRMGPLLSSSSNWNKQLQPDTTSRSNSDNQQQQHEPGANFRPSRQPPQQSNTGRHLRHS